MVKKIKPVYFKMKKKAAAAAAAVLGESAPAAPAVEGKSKNKPRSEKKSE